MGSATDELRRLLVTLVGFRWLSVAGLVILLLFYPWFIYSEAAYILGIVVVGYNLTTWWLARKWRQEVRLRQLSRVVLTLDFLGTMTMVMIYDWESLASVAFLIIAVTLEAVFLYELKGLIVSVGSFAPFFIFFQIYRLSFRNTPLHIAVADMVFYVVLLAILGFFGVFLIQTNRWARQQIQVVPLIYDGTIEVGDLFLDTKKRQATWKEKDLLLTPIEFRLLAAMARQAGVLISHDRLLEAGWPGGVSDPELLKMHIKRLRDKLGEEKHYIVNVRGEGYMLDLGRTSKVSSGNRQSMTRKPLPGV